MTRQDPFPPMPGVGLFESPIVVSVLIGALIGAGAVFAGYWALLIIAVIGTIFLWLKRGAPRFSTTIVKPTCSCAGQYCLIVVLALLGINIARWAVFLETELAVTDILGNLIMIVSAYPLWHYLRSGDRPLPFAPILALLYGIYFGLPAIVPLESHWVVQETSQESRTKALELTLLGLLLFLAAVYAWPDRYWRGILPRFTADWARTRVLPLAVLMAVVSVPARVALAFQYVPEAFNTGVNLLGEMLSFSCAMLLLLNLRGHLPLMGKILLWGGLVPAEIALDLGLGFVTPIVRFGTLLFMVYAAVRRAIPWRVIIIMLPLLLALQGTKESFRVLTWGDENRTTEGELIGKSVVFLDLAVTFLSEADPDLVVGAFERLIQRVNYFAIFSYIVEMTPAQVPYWEGSTYVPLLTRALPRLVFPDKPREEVGQDFGHQYRLLASDDYNTSLNLAQMPELYANFGVAGVLVGMFLLGVVCGGLNYMFNHSELGDFGLVAGAVILTGLTHIESNFSLVYGGLFYLIPVVYLLREAFRPRGGSRFPYSSPLRTRDRLLGESLSVGR